MEFAEYQIRAASTAIYDPEVARYYTILGLANEAGEVAGALKKYTRGDFQDDELQRRVRAELGDVLWYVAAVASAFDVSLADIAAENLAKLAKRRDEGKLQGDGDVR